MWVLKQLIPRVQLIFIQIPNRKYVAVFVQSSTPLTSSLTMRSSWATGRTTAQKLQKYQEITRSWLQGWWIPQFCFQVTPRVNIPVSLNSWGRRMKSHREEMRIKMTREDPIQSLSFRMTGSAQNTCPLQNQRQFPEGNYKWHSRQPGLLTWSLAKTELTELACTKIPNFFNWKTQQETDVRCAGADTRDATTWDGGDTLGRIQWAWASLGYIARSCLKVSKQQINKTPKSQALLKDGRDSKKCIVRQAHPYKNIEPKLS